MRLIALAALPLLLSACGAPSGLLVATYAIDGASYVGTGKSVSGHALSAATKKDCSVLYGLTRGQWCEDVPAEQPVASDTRVPDIDPAGAVREPVIMGDASQIEIEDDFAHLETTKTSVEILPKATVRKAPVRKAKATVRKVKAPVRKSKASQEKHTPLWTLVVGTFDNEAAAEDLVKRLRPESATITVSVVQGDVAYRVTTAPFKISDAESRKERVAHLELPDVHVVRVCPAWMQDDRCVMLERAKVRQRAKLDN